MTSVTSTMIHVQTSDGRMPVRIYRPEGSAALPAAIFYFDAGGIRPSMESMASRLAASGYVVALPDFYYRLGEIAPFEFKTVFNPGPERDRLFETMATLHDAKVNADTGAVLAHFKASDGVFGKRFGATGYCMGGRYAILAAAAHPDDFAAVAAFHASRLATDQPNSPHRAAERIRARVYVAPAGIDPGFTTEECTTLADAFRTAKTDHRIEVYEGVEHGYAVDDSPVYDAAAAEKHWSRLLELFASTLPRSA